MQLTDLNIGVLFILAICSMGVYGIALAGWSSNNKYALLGGLRSSAQMISYELPMSLAIAAPLLIANTLSLREIVNSQAGSIWIHWNGRLRGPFPQIFSFIIFMIAAFAETNRIPFDLPEAENELVAGFHVEYSSMKFAAFFMAEYANMVTVCCDRDAACSWAAGMPLWPVEYGSNFVALADFLLCRRWSASITGSTRRATATRFHAPGVRRDLLRTGAACCSCRSCNPGLMPLFWFLRQDRRPAVRFHLDSRHAAALPLRPVDGFRLEVPVPGGAVESAGHRLSGGLVFVRMA